MSDVDISDNFMMQIYKSQLHKWFEAGNFDHILEGRRPNEIDARSGGIAFVAACAAKGAIPQERRYMDAALAIFMDEWHAKYGGTDSANTGA